ncbi:Ribosomal RNA large subunit methyltransferase F-like [Cryptosporidium meleagridis]
MGQANNNKSQQKKATRLHHRNVHANDDFLFLSERYPELKKCIKIVNNKVRINYNPAALYCISKVLLHYRYNINWDIPDKFLIPTIPSRANYVHFISDLLTPEHFYNTEKVNDKGLGSDFNTEMCIQVGADVCFSELIPRGKQVLGLDIGIGANCVFSLLCNRIYSWDMIGSDISIESLDVSDTIIKKNNLSSCIKLLHQENSEYILFGILDKTEIEDLKFSFTICNPPYFDSVENSEINMHPARFRSCQKHEIITHGGESQFILKLYFESKNFSKRVIWYTSQVSKLKNLRFLKSVLGKEIINNELKSLRYTTLKQGKHDKWVIAWSFFEKEERISILKFLRNNKNMSS